jgi:hypothetical protein
LISTGCPLDDIGCNPERPGKAIHEQLPDQQGQVPVHDIAPALDVEAIREDPLKRVEGAHHAAKGLRRDHRELPLVTAAAALHDPNPPPGAGSRHHPLARRSRG